MRLSLRSSLGILVLANIGFGQVVDNDQSPKISPDLAQILASDSKDDVDVIVTFKEQAKNRSSERSWNARRVRVNHDLPLINGMAIRVPIPDVAGIAASADVAYISPDRDLTPTLNKGRAAVQQEVQWNTMGYDGDGLRVAVIDSGINDNEAFKDGTTSRLVYQKSFIKGVSSTSDGYGHGTHVASVIAGDGEGADTSTAKYRGMAPYADIVNLRVLDDNGAGKDSYVIAALQWITENKADRKSNLNIRVVNMSLGRPVYESYKNDPLCKAVEAVWQAGIVVVVAAGNDGRNNQGNSNGYGTINSPGNDPYVITVGASNMFGTETRIDDMPTSYSSKGPSMIDHIVKPDILAPGNKISALGSGKLKANNPANVTDPANSYMQMSGTSMATPFVAGAALLLLEKNPQYTPDQVKYLLMKNAWRGFAAIADVIDGPSKFTVRNDIFTVGAGYLDIYAAINDTYTGKSSSQSPTAVYNATTKKVTLISGASVVWGESTAAFSVVWGNNVVAGTNVVWGDSVVWGNATPAANNVVWGDKCVNASKGDDVAGETNKVLLKGE